MLFRLSLPLLCAVLVAACGDAPAGAPAQGPDVLNGQGGALSPPAPDPLPTDAGSPPPIIPPPPRECGSSDAECEAYREQQEKDRAAADARLLETATRDGDLPPFADRTDPNPDRGSWLQKLTPDKMAQGEQACTFSERPRSARPKNLVVQASSGNMDLLADGFVLAHDHAIGFVEAGWLADKPVIAVRDGMPDLWIVPKKPLRHVVLRIGAEELRCVRWDGRG